MMTPTRMPLRTASTVTFFYALGYPIGNMAVHALSPMAVLAFRFGFAALVLGAWTQLARRAGAQRPGNQAPRAGAQRPGNQAPRAGAQRPSWPTGRKLAHVAVAGLLMQAVQFCALYYAIEHGAPAVLCAVVIAMNPVATGLLAAAFLGDPLTPGRVAALVLGVLAVLAACASRLITERGVDPAVLLLLVALGGLAAGGVYQQRFCADVDYRASTTVQNVVAFVPALALTLCTPFEVHDPTKAVLAVAGVVLLNAALGVSLYVRAINLHGASAVAMLFCVIPAVAGVLSWAMLGERVDLGVGVGLVLGAAACWLNSRSGGARTIGRRGGRRSSKQRQDHPADDRGRQHRVDAVHDATVTR